MELISPAIEDPIFRSDLVGSVKYTSAINEGLQEDGNGTDNAHKGHVKVTSRFDVLFDD